MSKQVKGLVFKVYDKVMRGGKVWYSIKIDNDPIYYRAFEKRFAGIAEPGNIVTFEAEMNPSGTDANITSDVTLVKQEPVAAQGTPSFNGGVSRDNSIVYQSSRKDAIEFVKLALSTEAVSVGTKKDTRLGILEALVDRYTAAFFDDVATLGAVTREAASDDEPVEAKSAKTEDDGE